MDGRRREQRPVVGSDVLWRTTLVEEVRRSRKDVAGIQVPHCGECDIFASVLVDERLHPDPVPVVGPILYEVVGPYVVESLWPKANKRAALGRAGSRLPGVRDTLAGTDTVIRDTIRVRSVDLGESSPRRGRLRTRWLP